MWDDLDGHTRTGPASPAYQVIVQKSSPSMSYTMAMSWLTGPIAGHYCKQQDRLHMATALSLPFYLFVGRCPWERKWWRWWRWWWWLLYHVQKARGTHAQKLPFWQIRKSRSRQVRKRWGGKIAKTMEVWVTLPVVSLEQFCWDPNSLVPSSSPESPSSTFSVVPAGCVKSETIIELACQFLHLEYLLNYKWCRGHLHGDTHFLLTFCPTQPILKGK